MEKIKKILLVEDNQELSTLIDEALEGVCEITRTSSVHDAQKLLSNPSPYDLVLCDKTLEDGSGFEVLEYFRSQGGSAPVIFLSGDSDVDDKLEGFRLNVYDYLEKPIAMRELRIRVLRALQL